MQTCEHVPSRADVNAPRLTEPDATRSCELQGLRLKLPRARKGVIRQDFISRQQKNKDYPAFFSDLNVPGTLLCYRKKRAKVYHTR